MFRIAYVNGRYCPYADATVHIEDRGYQFADAVYEVIEIHGGTLIDEVRHLARLERSLGELSIAMPMSRRALAGILRRVARRNRVHDGSVYIQVSRGVAKRDHLFPAADTPPAVVVFARSSDPRKADARAQRGIRVAFADDERWARVDIKTVGLLANVLARQKAQDAGADDVWLVDRDGYVTEGAANTAWIVTRDGVLVTRPNGSDILPGVTRASLESVAREAGYRMEERKFTIEEAQAAREAFVTSASTAVTPVVAIGERTVANGAPGEIAGKLRALFRAQAPRTAL